MLSNSVPESKIYENIGKSQVKYKLPYKESLMNMECLKYFHFHIDAIISLNKLQNRSHKVYTKIF